MVVNKTQTVTVILEDRTIEEFGGVHQIWFTGASVMISYGTQNTTYALEQINKITVQFKNKHDD
jgi:hypothetical protein